MTRLRAMIVDDNPLNLEMARFLMESDGWEVLALGDGNQVRERLPDFAPDLVLMDIQLPGIDGLQLTRGIKTDPATRHICVIAFTAYAMKGDDERMRAAGCDGYISKPIDVATFAATVRGFRQA